MKKTIFILYLCLFSFCFSMEKKSENALISSIGQFNFSFLQTLQGQENEIFSPFSIASSLYMLLMGAEDKTAKEMQNALHIKLSKDSLAANYNRLYTDLLLTREKCEIRAANICWVDVDSPILPSFQKSLVSNFHAYLAKGNFYHNSGSEIEKINRYIAETTEYKITNLISSSDVTSDTRLVLINTLYLKGSWKKPFDSSITEPAPFYLNETEQMYTPTMHQMAEYPYFEDDLFQVVALPLNCDTPNKELSLLVFLPKNSLQDAMQRLTWKRFQKTVDQLTMHYIDLHIPKFTLDRKYKLKKNLTELGITDAFTRVADFSGINGRLDLYLSNVLHQGYLSVDEKGVLATAATAAILDIKSLPPLPTLSFMADHPFCLCICDVKNKTILFFGKVLRPASAS